MTLTKIHQFTGHNGSVYALAQGTSPAMVLSGSADHFIAQWNLATLQPDNFSARFPSTVYCVFPIYEMNILCVGTSTGSLHLIDLSKKEEVKILQYHTAGIFDMQVSFKHRLLISAGADGKLNVYKLDDFKHLHTFSISQLKLRNIALDEGKNELALCDGNGCLHILNLPDFSIQKTFKAHELSCNCVLYYPDGKYLLSGGRDAHLNIWDRENNFQLVQSIPAHNYAIYDIKYLDGKNMFATASRDKTIKLWNADDFSFILRINKETYNGHINSVNKLHWNKEEQVLVSASDDRSLIVWKIS